MTDGTMHKEAALPAELAESRATPPADLERIFTEHQGRVFRAAYRVTGSLSDADIFGWLSDSDTATDLPNASDTTIVKATDLHPVVKSEPKPVFRTIGEEARDIIRRHKESLEKPS